MGLGDWLDLGYVEGGAEGDIRILTKTTQRWCRYLLRKGAQGGVGTFKIGMNYLASFKPSLASLFMTLEYPFQDGR